MNEEAMGVPASSFQICLEFLRKAPLAIAQGVSSVAA
jgi:hypothetical protein